MVITSKDACELVEAIAPIRETLCPEMLARLDQMARYHLRDADVLANYKKGKKNRDLCERWQCSQSILAYVWKKQQPKAVAAHQPKEPVARSVAQVDSDEPKEVRPFGRALTKLHPTFSAFH